MTAFVLVAHLLAQAEPTQAQASGAPQARPEPVLEIRSYNLKPGTRDDFHGLFLREALPMLRRWKVDVVAHGPSLHDRDSYFLMRAFSSAADRERSEDAFYGSSEWRNGPRAAVLEAIDSYTTVVIHVDDATLGVLRGAIDSRRVETRRFLP